ncbi:MAG: hypothetical protein ACI8XO_001931 [Verrucomicrobiales bacterium]|jgi:hypothetical protein
MGEIIHDALLLYNLPLTALLGLSVAYWISVGFGMLDVGSFDTDIDMGADADVDLDLDADADLDAHGDIGGGALMGLAKFVNVHEVPLMVVLSIQFVFMWMIGMISNYYLNPGESLLIGGGLLFANFIVSGILTRICTAPLKPLMRGLKKEWDDAGPIIGNTGLVKTSEITDTFGQVEILRQGAPTLCTARTPEGAAPIKRGETALVIDYNTETQTCIVKRLEGDQLEI